MINMYFFYLTDTFMVRGSLDEDPRGLLISSVEINDDDYDQVHSMMQHSVEATLHQLDNQRMACSSKVELN